MIHLHLAFIPMRDFFYLSSSLASHIIVFFYVFLFTRLVSILDPFLDFHFPFSIFHFLVSSGPTTDTIQIWYFAIVTFHGLTLIQLKYDYLPYKPFAIAAFRVLTQIFYPMAARSRFCLTLWDMGTTRVSQISLFFILISVGLNMAFSSWPQ